MDPKQIISGVVFFVLILTIIAVIYMTLKKLYNPFNTGLLIIDKPVKITSDMVPCVDKMPDGADHTYSFWCFVSEFHETPNQPKMIFSHEFQYQLDPYKLNVAVGGTDADLLVFITDKYENRQTRKKKALYYSNARKEDGVEPDSLYPFDRPGLGRLTNDLDDTHIIHGLPLQAWNHVTIVVYDKTLDLYLNGKLARTFVLERELQMLKDSLIQVGSVGDEITYNGYISRFRYYPRIVSPQEIYKIYLAGPAKASNLSEKRDDTRLNLTLSMGKGPSCDMAV